MSVMGKNHRHMVVILQQGKNNQKKGDKAL